jgi:hypothetical protein
MTQSVNPTTVDDGIAVACEVVGTGVTLETNYSRSFDLSVCPSTDNSFALSCVTFAVEFNSIANYDVMVNVYEDLDGGAPQSTPGDLVLLGSVIVTIPVIDENTENDDKFFTADFTNGGVDDPIFMTPNAQMVVELHMPDRSTGDGGMIRAGFNDDGETANTYIQAVECGVPEYRTLSFLGFNLHHLIMTVEGDLVEGASIPCPGDCADGGDGQANVTDLLAMLAGWGLPSQPCDIANDDDTINVSDLLLLLDEWGPCPTTAPFCIGDTNNDGTVDITDMLLVLAEWGVVSCSLADFDYSGVVDINDLLTVLASWGSCPT